MGIDTRESNIRYVWGDMTVDRNGKSCVSLKRGVSIRVREKEKGIPEDKSLVGKEREKEIGEECTEGKEYNSRPPVLLFCAFAPSAEPCFQMKPKSSMDNLIMSAKSKISQSQSSTGLPYTSLSLASKISAKLSSQLSTFGAVSSQTKTSPLVGGSEFGFYTSMKWEDGRKEKVTAENIIHESLSDFDVLREKTMKFLCRSSEDSHILQASHPLQGSHSGRQQTPTLSEKKNTEMHSNMQLVKECSSMSRLYSINSSNSQAITKEKVVQLLVSGVWVFRRVAHNLCEITMVSHIKDEGNLGSSTQSSIVRSSLDVVNDLKFYFERNGLETDKELREEFICRIPSVVTTRHQKSQILERLISLGVGGNDTNRHRVESDLEEDDWKPVEDLSTVFVKVSQSSRGWFRTDTVVDASAEEALAWLWDYCSNQRYNKHSLSFPGFPREVVLKRAPNSIVVLKTEAYQWPLRPRQYIIEAIWAPHPADSGSFILMLKPDHEFCDLNLLRAPQNAVIGNVEVVCILKNLDLSMSACKISYFSNIKLNGMAPLYAAQACNAAEVRVVHDLSVKFERNEEADKLEREELGKIMYNDAEVYSNEEIEQFDSIVSKMSRLKDFMFTKLRSPDPRTEMSIAYIDGESSAYFKCQVVVDATLEECAAYNYTIMSRKRIKLNDKKSILFRGVKVANQHSLDNLLVRDFGYGLRPRVFLTRHIWKKVVDSVTKETILRHAYFGLDTSSNTPFQEKLGAFKNSIWTQCASLYTYEHYEDPDSSYDQTLMVYVSQVDLGGILPPAAVSMSVVGFLSDYIVMRKQFNKDYLIDGEKRKRTLEVCSELLTKKIAITKPENSCIDMARERFNSFSKTLNPKSELDIENDFIIAIARKVEGETWIKLSTHVRGSSIEVLSFFLDANSRALLHKNENEFTKQAIWACSKEGFEQEMHTRAILVEEETSALENVQVHNIIARKIVFQSFGKDARGHGESGGFQVGEGTESALTHMYACPSPDIFEAADRGRAIGDEVSPGKANKDISHQVKNGGSYERRRRAQSIYAQQASRRHRSFAEGQLSLSVTDKFTKNISRQSRVTGGANSFKGAFTSSSGWNNSSRVLRFKGRQRRSSFWAGKNLPVRGDDTICVTRLFPHVDPKLSTVEVLFRAPRKYIDDGEVIIKLKEIKFLERNLKHWYDYRTIEKLQFCFANECEAKNLNEYDGKILAMMLCGKKRKLLQSNLRSHKANMGRAEIFFEEAINLKELPVFFKPMIVTIVTGRYNLKNFRSNGVMHRQSKLDLLLEPDGVMLGSR